ncbi:MAG: hypothetical protein R2873_03210 [Caldilineaceae bacterium]
MLLSARRRRPAALILLVLGFLLTTAPTWAQSPTPQPRAGDVPGTAAGCNELLINGGFEVENLGWEPFLPGLPAELDAQYVTSPVFAGTRAMKLGLVGATNTALTNGIQQIVTLPAAANPIVLTMQLLPVHEANPGADLQFVDIYDAYTDELLVRVWAKTADSGAWIAQQDPLTSLAGRTVRVSIGVSNDGVGGRTALYIDSISLQACPSGTAIATSTPTSPAVIPTVLVTATPTTNIIVATQTPTPVVLSPTPIILTPSPVVPTVTNTPILPPTPLPPGCITNVILNGSFEEEIVGSTGWILGDDPVPPRLVAGGFDGLRSLRLGNPPDGGYADVLSYSSARQLITIPATAVTAELLWWHSSHTQDNGEPGFGNRVDRQELILLSPELVTLEQPLYRKMLNTGGWTQQVSDLTAHRGQTLYIYFNVLNDGDGLRTWMELDQVQLKLCFPTPTPLPIMPLPAELTPTITSTSPIETPTPSTTPAETLDADAAATRAMAATAEATNTAEAEERSLEESALEQVSDEQPSLAQRVMVAVQQFWWLGVIAVVLWAAWGFVSSRT